VQIFTRFPKQSFLREVRRTQNQRLHSQLFWNQIGFNPGVEPPQEGFVKAGEFGDFPQIQSSSMNAENEEFQQILEREKQSLQLEKKDDYEDEEFEEDAGQDILFTEQNTVGPGISKQIMISPDQINYYPEAQDEINFLDSSPWTLALAARQPFQDRVRIAHNTYVKAVYDAKRHIKNRKSNFSKRTSVPASFTAIKPSHLK